VASGQFAATLVRQLFCCITSGMPSILWSDHTPIVFHFDFPWKGFVMPGVYSANRYSAPGRAGLALPFTPTTGPVRFGADARDFLDVPMYYHFSGTASKVPGGGLQTHLISECAVFGAAEWTGLNWGNVYFTHIQGGDWSGNSASDEGSKAQERAVEALRQFVRKTNVNNCFSFMLIPGPFGYSQFANFPKSLGFKKELLSVYISNTSSSLGCAVEFRTMGEFGELDSPISANRETNYGILSRTGKFSNW